MFQILANSPARKALFTWPPGETYDTSQFSKLASNVKIDSPVQSATASPASSSSSRGDHHNHAAQGHESRQSQGLRQYRQNDPDSTYAEVKTSCTRRYKSQQSFQSSGALYDVESIFIPHGSVIFACHQVVGSRTVIPSTSSFDLITSSSATAFPSSSFKTQSQAWTLKPNPHNLHSLSTTSSDSNHNRRYPPLPSITEAQAQIQTQYAAIFNSPSHPTPTSAASTTFSTSSTASSAYPATPASAPGSASSSEIRDRDWPPAAATDSWSHDVMTIPSPATIANPFGPSGTGAHRALSHPDSDPGPKGNAAHNLFISFSHFLSWS